MAFPILYFLDFLLEVDSGLNVESRKWKQISSCLLSLIILDIDESLNFYCDFPVDLLNNIEGAGSIHIPAAPLFTVILALVGKFIFPVQQLIIKQLFVIIDVPFSLLAA